MTPLLEAACGLQSFLEERNWRFAIIGGLALLRWGEPRFTRDVDVSLLCGFGREDEFIAPFFASGYRGRISDAACSADDPIVLKLFAFRPRDLADVESVVMRQESGLGLGLHRAGACAAGRAN